MESLHKVGDIVTIKSKYDKDCNGYDYPYIFNDYMLRKYGGQKMKIKSVHIRHDNFLKPKLYTEDCYYKLYNDDYELLWSDPMFEECEL